MLNYGDAVAHLHIARRVFDSRTPRISQLGSVWLPLPHILLIPFVQNYAWWATGLAGVIPSALAYIASCAGLYRLARHWLSPAPAALALAFFALNPNLLYLQTTAMTEPLFLCEMIWIVVWLVEWRSCLDRAQSPVQAPPVACKSCIAAALVAAIFTRYDGWIIALIAWTGIGFTLLRAPRRANAAASAPPSGWPASPSSPRRFSGSFTTPSASATGSTSRAGLSPPRPSSSALPRPAPGRRIPAGTIPGSRSSSTSKSLSLTPSPPHRQRACWAISSLRSPHSAPSPLAHRKIRARRRALAWIAAPLAARSLLHLVRRLRIGAHLLSRLVALHLVQHALRTRAAPRSRARSRLRAHRSSSPARLSRVRSHGPRLAPASFPASPSRCFFALAGLNVFVHCCAQHPLVYAESTKNLEARLPYDNAIPPLLQKLLSSRPHAPVLMDTSIYPEIVAFTGIPLRQTINESDLEIFRAALAAPASHAAIVVAFDGDAIDEAVKAHPADLTLAGRFTAKDQPSATVYAPRGESCRIPWHSHNCQSAIETAPNEAFSCSTAPSAVVASGKETAWVQSRRTLRIVQLRSPNQIIRLATSPFARLLHLACPASLAFLLPRFRRKIDSVHQGPRLRQRFPDRRRRSCRQTTIAPVSRAAFASATPALAPTALSFLPGRSEPGPSPAASAFTTPTAPSPKSAATAPAASPRGWPKSLGSQPGDELQIATDAGLARLPHRQRASGHDFSVEVTTGMGVPRFVPHTLKLIDGAEVIGVEVSTGNPHFVILVENPDFAVAGRAWTVDRRGDLRASRFPAPDQRRICARRERTRNRDSHLRARRRPNHLFRHRQFRRRHGCLALRRCVSPLTVVAPGGAQTVAWDGPGTELYLTGPAALIARGEAW